MRYSQAHYWNGRTRGTSHWHPLRALLCLFCPYLIWETKGEEVSKPDVNLLPRWVHGSPKSGDFTKSTICGNIRERCPFFLLCNALIRDSMPRNLQKRRDIREKAWQNDGWAETVSKARFPMSLIGMTLLTLTPQTAQLAQTMDAFILTPLSFSPLK